jgi:hypothetical protein
LHIKKDNIQTKTRLDHVQNEIDTLRSEIEPFLNIPRIASLYVYLDFFNRKIWELCDKVRVSDANRFDSGTDEEYSTFCKDIIKLNDARFRVKNKINDWSFSNLKEQKNFKGICLCIKLNQSDIQHLSPIILYLSMCYDEILLNSSDECITPEFLNEKNIFEGNYEQNCVDVSSTSTPIHEKIHLIEKLFKFSYPEVRTIYDTISKQSHANRHETIAS